MSEPYTVDQLGAIGWISEKDREDFELDPRALIDGRNTRVERGAVEAVKGFLDVWAPGVESIWADWGINSTGSWWVIFSDTEAYSYDGDALTKVNVDPFSASQSLYDTTKINSVLCVTDGVTDPRMQWDVNNPELTGPATPFVKLDGWTSGDTCRILIAHKNYLIAMGLRVDGVDYPSGLRWSNAAAPGQPPLGSNSWTPLPDNDASDIVEVAPETGAIVGAELLRDDVIIYTETAAFRMHFIGGERIYDITRLLKFRGMYGQNCVAEFQDRHYVITDDDVIVHDGTTSRSIADGKVRNFLQDLLSEDTKRYVWMYGHRAESELGIAYHNEGQATAANESLVYNVLQDTWNTPRDEPDLWWKREMPDLQFSDPTVVIWDEVIEPDDSWDTGPDIPAAVSPGDLVDSFLLYGSGPQAIIREFNVGNRMAWPGNPVDIYVNAAAVFEVDPNTPRETAYAQTLYPSMSADFPDGSGVNGVVVEHGVRWSHKESWDYQVVGNYSPKTQHEVDIEREGRQHAVKVSTTNGYQFRWSGFQLEWGSGGQYG